MCVGYCVGECVGSVEEGVWGVCGGGYVRIVGRVCGKCVRSVRESGKYMFCMHSVLVRGV